MKKYLHDRECQQRDCPINILYHRENVFICGHGSAHKKDFGKDCKGKKDIVKYYKDNNLKSVREQHEVKK